MDIKIKLVNSCDVDLNIKNDNIIKCLKKTNKIKQENFFLEIPKVDDVYRYKIFNKDGELSKKCIGKNNAKFKNSEFNDKTVNQDKIIRTIVLLLESPHQYEYDCNNMPKAPAQGVTGDNIDKHIVTVIKELICLDKNLLNEDSYRLIICNPVQYQTSLFMYHKQKLKDEYSTLRNQVWNKIWSEEKIRKDFKNRIDEYNPSLIINACTYLLQDRVTKYLLNNGYSNIYTTYHPSYWNGFNIKKQK